MRNESLMMHFDGCLDSKTDYSQRLNRVLERERRASFFLCRNVQTIMPRNPLRNSVQTTKNSGDKKPPPAKTKLPKHVVVRIFGVRESAFITAKIQPQLHDEQTRRFQCVHLISCLISLCFASACSWRGRRTSLVCRCLLSN